jgi:hypothetical protein
MKYYADGLTIKSNPSFDGGGYTVANEKGDVLLHRMIDCTPEKPLITNNETELLAAYHACKLADNNDEIVVDSANTLAWIKRPISKVRPDLMGIAAEARETIIQKNLSMNWRPRDENTAGWFNETLGVEPKFDRSDFKQRDPIPPSLTRIDKEILLHTTMKMKQRERFEKLTTPVLFS